MTDDPEDLAIGVRGRAMQAATELPLVSAICAALRQHMLEKAVKSAPADTALRERMIAGAQIIDAILTALNRAILDGNTVEAFERIGEETSQG